MTTSSQLPRSCCDPRHDEAEVLYRAALESREAKHGRNWDENDGTKRPGWCCKEVCFWGVPYGFAWTLSARELDWSTEHAH